jgi:hypothetical protein
MNYATLGDKSSPALLLIPGQTESWWATKPPCPGWPSTSRCLPWICGARAGAPARRVGTRSTTWATTWSVFIDTVIGRVTYVSGLSSGGVLTAWLSAYAKPGQVVAALYEDPPLLRYGRAAGW